MKRATVFGLMSLVCVGASLLPPYESWKQPVNAALLIIAFALSYKAGRLGSAWWWCVGGLLVLLLGTLLWVSWHSLG